MWTAMSNVQVAQPCDMRRQMNGLATTVRAELGRDPEGGDLFVFRNRRGDMIKILFFDARGCCLLCKRLHEGTFKVGLHAANGGRSILITQRELVSLLSDAEIVERTAETT